MNINSTDREAFYELFVNRNDVYAIQQSNGAYFPEHKKLTADKFFNSKTIGLYQLSLDNKVKWAVLDIDIKKEVWKQPDFNVDDWNEKLLKQVTLAKNIFDKAGVHSLIEFSGNKGYHLWVFFDKEIDAGSVKDWMQKLFKDMKAADPAFDWEIFPKQAKLDEIKGLGNLVKAPLHLHKKSMKFSFFIDHQFNKIEGLPEVIKYDTALIPKVETPKAETFKITSHQNKTADQLPLEKFKEVTNSCSYFKTLIEKLENERHLNHEERIRLANLLKPFGNEVTHNFFSKLTDYDRDYTESKLDSLKGNPSLCSTICGTDLCENIKKRGNRSPIAFAYNTMQRTLINPDVPWVFIEGKTSAYHYLLDGELEIAKSKTFLKDTLASFGMKLPDAFPFFSFKFDVHDDTQINHKTRMYNLFTPTKYLLMEKTEESLTPDIDFPCINKLLSNLIPVNDEREHFINWLSAIVNTRDNQMTAWVFTGGQGAGKNLFFENILKPLLGEKQTKLIDDKTLKSDFNGYLRDVFFMAFNEVASSNNERNKLNSIIKSIVTDEEHVIHMKFINPFSIKNNTNCIFFSNEKVPLIVEEDDRRFNIVQTGGKLSNKEWFKKDPSGFIKDMKNEVPNFAQYLKNYDFDENKSKIVITNDIKRRITNAGMNRFEEFALKLKVNDVEWFSDKTDDSIVLNINFNESTFAHSRIERSTAKLIFNEIHGEDISLHKLTKQLELYGITVTKSGNIRYYKW